MGTLSCWVIHKPRTTRECEGIFHHHTHHAIPAGTPQVRCFGHPGSGRPYTAYLCLDCGRMAAGSSRKVARALEEYDAKHGA